MEMSSSAETVANIEGLLKQILISVPALSLIRFTCVSKHWLALISDPDFRRRHTLQNPNPKISAFFNCKIKEDFFKSIPLETPSGNPFKTLNSSVPDGSKLRILQSCNGLFLCHVPIFRKQKKHHPVYVVNPSTNSFRAVSSPRIRDEDMGEFAFIRYALAFEPSKSSHFKVVCVANSEQEHEHQVDIYSSETGNWKHLNIPFLQSPSDAIGLGDYVVQFDGRSREGAVFCNGAIHWIRNRMEGEVVWWMDRWLRGNCDVLHYFDVGEECLRLAPSTPPVPLVVKNIPVKDPGIPTEWPRLAHRYFGESGGNLYLIETYNHCKTQFDVMEMERDYSGWFSKYSVDLKPLVAAFPGKDWNAFVLLGLSGEEKTYEETDYEVEDSSADLLLHMPGKIISYNLRNKTFKTSVELASEEFFLALDDNPYIREDVIFPYMESLSCL